MLKQAPRVEGLKTVFAGFWKVKGSTAERAEAALKRAGAFLLAESKKLVPVEYGNLKASGFVRADGSGFRTKISIGYTAAYAMHVHELTAMKLRGKARISRIGVYWDPRPRAQAKFLERPARELLPQVRKLIYGEFQK